MGSKVCYICGKTQEEVEKLIDSQIESIVLNNPDIKSEQNATMTELEKVENAIKSKDVIFLSNKYMAAILLSEQQLAKYGSWDREKLAAAKKCDYPFETGELELIEHIFPGSCNKQYFNYNIKQWYDYSNKVLMDLKSKLPKSEDARNILSANGYEVPSTNFKDVHFGCVWKRKRDSWGKDVYLSYPLTVCVCPICDSIIEDKIRLKMDELPITLLG